MIQGQIDSSDHFFLFHFEWVCFTAWIALTEMKLKMHQFVVINFNLRSMVAFGFERPLRQKSNHYPAFVFEIAQSTLPSRW